MRPVFEKARYLALGLPALAIFAAIHVACVPDVVEKSDDGTNAVTEGYGHHGYGYGSSCDVDDDGYGYCGPGYGSDGYGYGYGYDD